MGYGFMERRVGGAGAARRRGWNGALAGLERRVGGAEAAAAHLGSAELAALARIEARPAELHLVGHVLRHSARPR